MLSENHLQFHPTLLFPGIALQQIAGVPPDDGRGLFTEFGLGPGHEFLMIAFAPFPSDRQHDIELPQFGDLFGVHGLLLSVAVAKVLFHNSLLIPKDLAVYHSDGICQSPAWAHGRFEMD